MSRRKREWRNPAVVLPRKDCFTSKLRVISVLDESIDVHSQRDGRRSYRFESERISSLVDVDLEQPSPSLTTVSNECTEQWDHHQHGEEPLDNSICPDKYEWQTPVYFEVDPFQPCRSTKVANERTKTNGIREGRKASVQLPETTNELAELDEYRERGLPALGHPRFDLKTSERTLRRSNLIRCLLGAAESWAATWTATADPSEWPQR